MNKVILFKGLPGSGKTTRAKEIVGDSGGRCKRINKDDLRAMLDDGKYSRHREEFILGIRDQVITASLRAGFDVIVDDTNLHERHEIRIKQITEALNIGAVVSVDDSFLQVPIKECIRRDLLRPNPVGKKVIREMAKNAGIGQIEPYHVEGLQSCVICDLDGTLALMGKRNPFDASTCEADEVNIPIADYLVKLKQCYPIFFFTGREEKYREQTHRWLMANGFEFYELLVMRPTGNYEKDVIIKTRMFEEHIRGKYNVHVVLDDRDQVVEGWRDLGLTCFQVADGDF